MFSCLLILGAIPRLSTTKPQMLNLIEAFSFKAQEQQLIIEQQAQMLDFLEREMASFKAEVLRLKRRRDARRAGHEPSLHAHRRAMACDFKRGRRKQLSPGIL